MTELKTELNYYDIVREKLAIGPLFASKHEKIFTVLKAFWDEEVIKVLSHFPSVGGVISLDELKIATGLEKKEIRRILKKAVKKKTIFKKGNKYGLSPLVPGVFEAYFIAREDTEENLLKVAEAFRYLIKNFTEFKPAMIREDFEMFRPLLPIEAKEKYIEVDEEVKHESQVLPYELVESLINENEFFAVVPCQCRYIGELTGEPCSCAPSEMGCFITGRPAQGIATFGYGKSLTKEEAIDYLKKTEKAGLIHCTSDSKGWEHLMFICNCCPCHCGIFSPMQLGFKTLVPSNFQPKVDKSDCTYCGFCATKCPRDAIMVDKAEEKIEIDLERCIGCGLCASNCPRNDIKMEKVQNRVPPDMKRIGDKNFMQHLGDLLI